MEEKDEKELTKEEKKALKEQKKLEKQRAKEEKKRAKEAKKAKDSDPEDSEGGTAAIIVVAFLIILVWLGILGVLIKMDVGGIGSGILYPILKDVPVVNRVLPGIEDELAEKKARKESEKEKEKETDIDEAYQFDSIADAVDEIKRLEKQVAKLKKQKKSNSSEVADLEAQVAQLQVYKDNQDAFEEEKEKFYEEVVYTDNAPDINTYKQYYEEIEPDNAEQIYKQVIQQLQADKEISDYAKTYSTMDPSAAATIFDGMTDNLKLVAKILGAMSVDDRSAILAAMDEGNAARLTEIMEPK